MSEVQIPGFEILGLIGRGGMASVWKARQISLDRTVAIKVLSAHFSHTAADIERFQDEARAAARLKHPGIVQVYDAGNQNGAYYFVMEYVAGYTVGDWQRRKHTLPEHEALTVAECVADALDYAWKQAGVIHCDIKPDNVIVDADGSVKVADLGLSRTIKAMSRGPGASGGEILGTPAYISPEQAMADPGLDCRSDIYSLGAMLFHLLTGQRLFHGNPDELAIELQCTGQDENPGQIVPTLSKAVCALIERMLAKDPQFRQPDWAAVKEDLARVKAGHLPAQLLPGHAISTVKRTALNRLQTGPDAAHAALERWQRNDRSGLLNVGLKIGAVVLGCVIAMIVSLNVRTRQLPKPPAGTTTTTTTTVPPVAAPAEGAERDFEAVRRWISENPDKPAEGARRMQDVATQTSDATVAALAAEELRKLQVAIRQEADGVMKRLAATTEPILAAGRFADAARVYEGYAGPGAAESASERRAMAQRILRRASPPQPPPAAQKPVPDQPRPDAARILAAAVQQVLTGRVSEAVASIAAVLESSGEDAAGELRSADRVLRDAAGVDSRVLNSFQPAVGQEITVLFNAGPQSLTVESVSATQVIATCRVSSGDVSASRRIAFGIQDLSMRERLSRMGGDDRPEVALVKGVLAYRARAYAHARRYFGTVPGMLGRLLVEGVDAAERPAEEAPAPGPQRGAEPVPKPSPAANTAAPAGRQTPLPRDIQAARNDVAQVIALMYRRNATLTPIQIEIATNAAGDAVSAAVTCASAMDLSPLAALTTLKSVVYRPAGPEAGALKELTGLRGLALERIVVNSSRVCDIGPLRGMPLRSASFADSPIRDLTPLRGMPLEELDLRRTSVIDLTPLAGMPLHTLRIDGTDVRRGQVLKTLPLKVLSAAGARMQDYSWLQGGTALLSLDLSGTSIRAIDALAGMPLQSLNLSKTPVSDVSSLAGLKLRRLLLNSTPVRDFSVLRGMPLEDLDVEGTAFTDMDLIAGMPLRTLNLSRSSVKDLRPLSDMPLQTLYLREMTLGDVSPLVRLPLKALDLRGCGSLSTRFIHGIKVASLWIDNPERHAVFIQSLPNLRYLNDEDLYYAEDSPFRRKAPPDPGRAGN